MHERQVPTIAGGVQRVGRRRQVLADDAGVADLLVAERQLVVGQADGARVVGELGVLEGTRVEGDGARLLAAREGDAAVQPPQRRELAVADRLAEGVGGTPEQAGRLGEIVEQQVRVGRAARERRAHPRATATRLRSQLTEDLSGLGSAAPFERALRADQGRLHGRGGHGRAVYKVYRHDPDRRLSYIEATIFCAGRGWWQKLPVEALNNRRKGI